MTVAGSVRPENNSNTISSQLRLNNFLDSLHLFGKGGAKISNDFDLDYFRDQVKSVRPDFVIIDIGTNDLAAGVQPLSVAVKVVDFANDLLHRISSVKHVRICSAILRDRVDISESELFKQKIFSFNNYLLNLCAVSYHVHKGFWTNSISEWSRDGIHPNNSVGRKNYKQSVRIAVFRSITNITKQ